VNFGGQVGTCGMDRRGRGLFDFMPTFKVNSALLNDDPQVMSFMANAIGALPLGAEGQFQPYASGGSGRSGCSPTSSTRRPAASSRAPRDSR